MHIHIRNIAAVFMSLSLAVSCCFGDFAAYAEEEKETAECSLLFEVSTGIVIDSKHSSEKVPVGTMNKLMTVLLAAEKIESGELSLDKKIKASSAANSMQGAQIWLMPGEEMTLEDLLKGVIIGNANDASVAVAEAVSGTESRFVELMNSRAEELGMKDTEFTNCCGYYDDSLQVSTAEDMSKLVSALFRYDFLRPYFTCWMDYLRDGATELVNANVLVRKVDGIAGFKAGFTENSGNCLAAAAERDGKAFGVILLGYEDKDNMFSEAKRLLNGVFSNYTVMQPPLPDEFPKEIAVKGGTVKEIPLEYGEIRNIVIPKGAAGSVSSQVFVPDYVYAPVSAGDKVGEVHFYRDDKFVFFVNITAGESAECLNIKKIMVILLKFLLSF